MKINVSIVYHLKDKILIYPTQRKVLFYKQNADADRNNFIA